MMGIDREIAERVMCWDVPPVCWNYGNWRPSENISQAFEVVEKMRELEYMFNVNSCDFDEMRWFAQFETPDYEKGGQAFTETLPLAICKAALRAMEE
jgi:hypothetical protein